MDKRSVTSKENGKRSKGRPITRYERAREQIQLLRAAVSGTTDERMKAIWAQKAQELEEKLEAMPCCIAGESL